MSTSAARRPARLLTQNSEMRQIGVWNWSLPAWAGRLADGRTYNTCPSAGVCAQACYASSPRGPSPAPAPHHSSALSISWYFCQARIVYVAARRSCNLA
ncbi:hypothetical protein ACFVYA_17325 [Amycolatopsis sp. NPDC058278]|uniref:GP88 family protein n=1 Tax=Amycolatopsis sp. NPDC058278 TaxID=3346417 RepID=UPI0036DA5827